MNKSEIYANRSIGVLGYDGDKRSQRDTEMQSTYGQCRSSKEGFNPDSGAGVTEIPAEYALGFEARSQADQQMLKMYNPCNSSKEGFNGYAQIGDNPFNPSVANAKQVSVSSIGRR